MKKELYLAPEVEVINVMVEGGFDGSYSIDPPAYGGEI